MKRWVPSLRSTLVLNQGPIWVFAVAIVAVTGFVLGVIGSWESATRLAVEADTFDSADVTAIASTVRLAWLVSLGGFFAFSIAGTAIAMWNHRNLQRRVARIVEFSEAERSGHLEPLDVLADDVLGAL